MEKAPINCDPIQISLFFDDELGAEDYTRVERHVETCASCRETLEDMRRLSGEVKGHIVHQYAETDFGLLEENVLKGIERKSVPFWRRWRDAFFSKRALIPVTGMAAAMLILLTLYRPQPSSGPSAIVTSLSGDMASVIIMETPHTRQTILWFSETN